MSDGGGHLALVLMLTLLHDMDMDMDGCGCLYEYVRLVFISGFWFGKKTPTLSIENIEKNPTTRSCS